MTDETRKDERRLFVARLTIGLLQGLGLYLLYSAYDAQTWPATDGSVFAPLLLVLLYVPPVTLQAISEARLRTTILWTVIATVLLASLAWYDIWRAWPFEMTFTTDHKLAWRPPILPTAGLFFFGGAGLFIAHALIVGCDIDRRFMATYLTHFDVSWKLAVQLGLSIVFVGVFWGLLHLGAALFNLIKLDFFEKLIEHRWFAIPVTTLAIAAALHLTDVRPALVRGTRTLLLVLFSWLLPLLAAIVIAFFASLTFTGLAPLWAFGHASALLLTVAATLIILINATYQDGADDRRAPRVLRIAATTASFVLLPLIAVAGYALWLRVNQYGWTNGRVATAACLVVGLSYAAGYLLAALPTKQWLKRIERVNFLTALLILVVLLALFTPPADPARISVADQMFRLRSGLTSAKSFDYNFLKREGGWYGRRALEELASTTNIRDAAEIRTQARAVLETKVNYTSPTVPTEPSNLASRMTVYPTGAEVPKSFFNTKWEMDPSSSQEPLCVTSANFRCDLLLVDIEGSGHEDVILFGDNGAVIYREAPAGTWRIAGSFDYYDAHCRQVFEQALKKQQVKAIEPDWRLLDLEIAGIRLHPKDALIDSGSPKCSR